MATCCHVGTRNCAWSSTGKWRLFEGHVASLGEPETIPTEQTYLEAICADASVNPTSTTIADCDVIEPGASSLHESLFARELRTKILQALDREMSKSEAARTFGVSRPSVKRYATACREGRPLAPNKHPGSKPEPDERARKLREADVEDSPQSPSRTGGASLIRWWAFR
jgi:hypothetical protein